MFRKSRLPKWLLPALAVLYLLYHYGWGAPFFANHAFSANSPDGRYRLDVYERATPFFTMPGDGGRRLSHVILRNRWGWKIGESTGPCEVFSDDLYRPGGITWTATEVSYAPARSMNLATGKCEC